MARPCALYRHFDKSGALLYVGISYAVIYRQQQHDSSAPWWREIARIEIAWYPSKAEAKAAERLAIVTEHPKHNRQHNTA